MSSFGNQFLQQLGTNDSVRDYQHASRTFVDSVYRLGPKSGALFHVYIDVNSQVNPGQPSEIGLMAKTVSLPKFNVQNKVLNAYNRKNVVQEKIIYDPLTITLHDDSADVVLKFWKGYYEHYYRDGDHQEQLYRMSHKYQGRASTAWGYSPRGVTNEAGTLPYINAIRIYSLHQKKYTGYTLINPTITSFQHGQHQQGEYNTLEHSMTVAYEAVKYETGAVSAATVRGFGTHYDNTPSPLASAGGTRSILGPGGLIDSISTVASDIESGNYIGAALGAFRTAKTFKGANLKGIATAEVKQTAMNILRGQNPQSTIFVPTPGAIADGLSKAVNNVTASVKNVTRIGNMNSQSNS